MAVNRGHAAARPLQRTGKRLVARNLKHSLSQHLGRFSQDTKEPRKSETIRQPTRAHPPQLAPSSTSVLSRSSCLERSSVTVRTDGHLALSRKDELRKYHYYFAPQTTILFKACLTRLSNLTFGAPILQNKPSDHCDPSDDAGARGKHSMLFLRKMCQLECNGGQLTKKTESQ